MRPNMYWGSDSDVFAKRVKAGAPQRAMLMYNMDDIIDNTRIAVDNGFTLEEMINSAKNVTPGSVCSSSIDFTLLNYDKSLSGFNFERPFAFFIGVDYTTDVRYSMPSDIAGNTRAYFKLYNITFQITNDRKLYYWGTQDSSKRQQTASATAMVVWSDTASPRSYYVKVYGSIDHDDATVSYTIYKIRSGNGVAGDQVTEESFGTMYYVSEYTMNRIQDMWDNRYCDIYYWYQYDVGIQRMKIAEDETTYTDTRTMYSSINVFRGKKPAKVLGQLISYSAVDQIAYGDSDASAYINAEWTSSKTIVEIFKNISSRLGFGLVPVITSLTGWDDVSNITYSSNPFMGMTGYTYRDLLGFVAESLGMSASVWRVYNQVSATGVTFYPYLYLRPFYPNGKTMLRDEYYDYTCEEYSTVDIPRVVVKQTDDDIGVEYPAANGSYDTTDALFIVNNPLLRYNTEEEIRNRTSYIYQRLSGRSGGYRPGAVECYSPLLWQCGDTFLLTDENDETNLVYIMAMRTTWNGNAECTIECTGDPHRNQERTAEYKKSIREGGKYHELIIDIEQALSRISDAESNVSTLQQTAAKIQSEVAGLQNENILRGTATLTNIGTGTDDGKWENEAWKTMGTASVLTLADSPIDFLNKGFSLASSDGYAGQLDIPVKAGMYTISCYARRVSGSYNVVMWFANLGLTCPLTDSWTKFKQTITVNQDTTYAAAFSVSSGSGSTGGEVQVCGMKLEAGNTATDWCEANNYAFTRISQTAAEIVAQINDELGNYATQTWTSQQISSSISTALGDYSTTQQTAQAITTAIQTNNGNYYTKTETAQQISSSISTALGDYSTTQQTAQAISAYVSNHAYTLVSGITITSAGVDITGSKYINLASGGYIACGDYWKFEDDGLWYANTDSYGSHKMYIGEAKNSYADDVYSAIGTKYTTYRQSGVVDTETINGAIEFYINSLYDTGSQNPDKFTAKLNYDIGGNIGYPRLYSEYSDPNISPTGHDHGALGLPTNYWGNGYIYNLYYYTLTQQSSRDSKHNIQPIPDMGTLIDRLVPVTYVYNGDQSEHTRYGLIHEDTIDIVPDICVGDKYAEANDKAINYMDLVPILLKEIQSLRTRVAELETKNGQN